MADTSAPVADSPPYAWSAKQMDVLSDLLLGDGASLLVSGPVQSGKSVSTCFGFCDFAAQWAGQDFILASRSQRQMSGAVLKYVREWHHLAGLKFRRRAEWWEAESYNGRGTNRYFTLLGTNEASEGRARSFTAAGALIDELTLVPQSFAAQIQARCSVPGARLVGITNPDSPLHWVHQDWIDGGVPTYTFGLKDNPTLTKAYIKGLKRLYHGAAKKRMVHGEWVSSEGLVYPYVRVAEPPVGTPRKVVVCADWASSGWCHAVLLGGFEGGDWYAMKEWLHNGQTHGHLNEIESAERIKAELVGGRKVDMAVADKSNKRFVRALGHVLGTNAYASYSLPSHEVRRGITMVRMWIEDGMLSFTKRCPETIRQHQLYRWCPNAAILGEDKPIKEDDHGCDAVRYGVWAVASAQKKKGSHAVAR